MAGAPFGNTNAIKNKLWSDTLRRAIAQDRGDRVRQAAERLLDEAAKGEPWAIKELADRLDGKSVQSNTINLILGFNSSIGIIIWRISVMK